MIPTQLHHALVYSTPLRIEDVVDLGQQLWLYNTRGHGDTEDKVIWVEGRLVKHEDAYTFIFASPMGLAQHPMDENEFHYRLTSYVVLI